MRDLFLSYARGDDEPFVWRLYHDLTRDGFTVWFDRVDMPNRALTFLQEIRDAVDRCQRLGAVIGPQALASPYVQAEWQHARRFAKGVVALLRLGDYDLIPKDLAQFHAVDFRESRPYPEALAELERVLAEPLAPLGEFLTEVPSLPPHFLERAPDLTRLSELVLADVQRPVAVTAAGQTTGLQGMGGLGKTVRPRPWPGPRIPAGPSRTAFSG